MAADNAPALRSAICYPHTGVRTLRMLKTGLLLWDKVEYIAPDDAFVPHAPREPLHKSARCYGKRKLRRYCVHEQTADVRRIGVEEQE